MHQHNQALFVFIGQHNGFNHHMLGHAQGRRRMRGAAVFYIVVFVRLKRHRVLAQKTNGGGDGVFLFAHGANTAVIEEGLYSA